MASDTYKVVRMYQRDGKQTQVVKRGLTLEQAQEHCRNPETSSSTCKLRVNVKHTEVHGPWFDGYESE